MTERMLERLRNRRREDRRSSTWRRAPGVVGFAAAALVGPSGRVIVSDFAERDGRRSRSRRAAELGLGQRRVPGARRRASRPAGRVRRRRALPLGGYMLMADAARWRFAETRRVLRERTGGSACAVFAGPEHNPWAALPVARAPGARSHAAAGGRGAGDPRAGGPGPPAPRCSTGRLVPQSPRIEEIAFVLPIRRTRTTTGSSSTGAAGAIAMVLERLGADERARVRR